MTPVNARLDRLHPGGMQIRCPGRGQHRQLTPSARLSLDSSTDRLFGDSQAHGPAWGIVRCMYVCRSVWRKLFGKCVYDICGDCSST